MIPYTIDQRADTGVNNITLGIWLFIASEVMLFGSLFSAYALLRLAAQDWPTGMALLSIRHGLANTVVLVAMTVTYWQARRAPAASAKRGLLVSTALAIVFLLVKGLEYAGELERGLLPSVSTFMALYFTLTGLHALHVAAGAVANLWVRGAFAGVGDAMARERLKAVGIYWAFVDAIWIIIFLLMYVA